MNELTKEERHSIYLEALAFYKYRVASGLSFGLCDAIEHAVGDLYYPWPYEYMEAYPEIFKHKPIDIMDGYWFNTDTQEGIQKRIDILEEAIKLTE